MARVTINIPDEVVTRVLTAVCANTGWADSEIHGPKVTWAKNQLIEWIKDHVRTYEGNEAAISARQDAIQSVEDEIIIT